MKIANINNVNYGKNTVRSTNCNFKGLWGKTKDIESYDSCNTYYSVEMDYYYPFLDESQHKVEKIKSEYPKCTSGFFTTAFPEDMYDKTVKLTIKSSLPFTEAEWLKYQNNKHALKPNVRNLIEESLKRFDLKHLLVR